MEGKQRWAENVSTESDCFDPESLPLDQRAWRYLTRTIMFLCHYDAFAIYKKSHKQAKYELYQRAKLRIEPDKLDVWRVKIRRVILCWLSYLLLRYLLLCALQVIVYKISRTTRLETVGRAPIEAHSTNWTNETGAGEPLDENLKLLFRLKQWMELLGNILSDYPSIALMLYFSLFVAVSFALCYLPHYYSRKPIDSPSFRFAFEPMRELRRIDILSSEFARTHLMHTNKSVLLKLHNRRGFFSYFEVKSSVKARRLTGGLMCGSDGRATEFSPDSTLRPLNYTHKYYLLIWRTVRYVAYTLQLGMVLFFARAQSALIGAIVSVRCATKRIEPCEAARALSPSDWYSLFEIVTQMYITGFLVILQLIGLFMASVAQLIVARDMETELGGFLRSLRLIGEARKYAQCSRQRQRRQQPLWPHKTSSEAPPPAALAEALRRERHLAAAILRALVKCELRGQDLRSDAQFMTEQATSILATLGCMLLVALLAGQLMQPELQGARANMIAAVWLIGNAVLVRCAHVYARIAHADGVAWSIAAQLARLAERRLARRADIADGLDYVCASWQRMAIVRSQMGAENSVRPFGQSLTFGRVLAINYYIVSLVALLRPSELAVGLRVQ